jgi:hypothetical protein
MRHRVCARRRIFVRPREGKRTLEARSEKRVTVPSAADIGVVGALARKCDEARERVVSIAPELQLDFLKGCLAEVSQELTLFHERYAP